MNIVIVYQQGHDVIYGPFATRGAAIEWAKRKVGKWRYECRPLHSPSETPTQ